MVLNNTNINSFMERYVSLTDQICDLFGYDKNIKHLLYVTIPSFVIKYGFDNEQIIIKCFQSTRILINKKDNIIQAFFDRELCYENEYYSRKYVVVNGMVKDHYIELVDSIVHEFNHAINSISNELKEEGENILLRTGISYLKYNKNNIKVAIDKSNNFVLEEIINTKQSEEILSIMSNLSNYSIENREICNFLEVLNSEIGKQKYKSKAYSLEMKICENLLKNKTFYSTLEGLRLKGDVEEIDFWFDNILGKQGGYSNLINLLYQIYRMEEKYSKVLFKKRLINKVKNNINLITKIIEEFNHNCIYK